MSTIPMSKPKTHRIRLLSEVGELGERVTITRSGKPVGVLLAVDEYEGLLETLEILADPELARAVQEGLEDLEAGRVASHEEVWSDCLDERAARASREKYDAALSRLPDVEPEEQDRW